MVHSALLTIPNNYVSKVQRPCGIHLNIMEFKNANFGLHAFSCQF